VAFENIVVTTMVAIMRAFLADEALHIGFELRIADMLERLAHSLDQEWLKIRHSQRCPVDHMAPFRVVRVPDGSDALVKSERDSAD